MTAHLRFPALAAIATCCVCLFALSVPADAQPPRREAWKTSKISGTPEPPPPYRAYKAFPHLSFDRPLLFDHVPGTNDLVVGQLKGQVLVFSNDQNVKQHQTAIDLSARQPSNCEALYGLAFHPKFTSNHFIYLCYVTRNDRPDGTRVSRFTATSTSPLKIDPSTEQVVLTYPSGGHNGGCLAFGNDGYLYISTGDAEVPTPPDPRKTGQDISDLLASILRIDVDTQDPGKAYRIPPDNPFVKRSGARPEVWSYGLRNPWRMSFDRQKGDLWIGDVGWELWEMIHLAKRGSNHGWSAMEASQPVLPDLPLGPTPIVPPVIAHPHSEAASITGGFVYHGKRYPSLQGVYIYGDYQSGKVWGLKYDGTRVTWKEELADTGLRIVSFGEDAAGEIYLVEYERSNTIYTLAPIARTGSPTSFPRTLSTTGLFESTAEQKPATGVIPYQINATMWSDGATAERFMAIPDSTPPTIDKEGQLQLPDSSVLARTVGLELVAGDPKSRKRVETQILHKEAGSWRPYSYAWNDAQTDATLVDAAGANKSFTIRDANAPGGSREQSYRIPARAECVLCHNPWMSTPNTLFGRQTASPLAMNVRQLDRGDRVAWLLEKPAPESLKPLTNPANDSAPLEDRARAYLQVNCSHCHQLNAGGAAYLVLGANVSLKETRAIDVPPAQGRFGITDARVIAPGAPERSTMFYRISKTGTGRMPRVGSDRVDPLAVKLIGDWIASMPASKPAAKLSGNESPADILKSVHDSLLLLREWSSLTDAKKQEILTAVRTAPAETRALFERFLPESERIKPLGDAFDIAALLVKPGDVSRGRALFRGDSGLSCKTCHKAEGQGGEVGPALDGIGSKYKTKAELLTQILEPSRNVEPKYAAHVIATKAGEVRTGLIVDENAQKLSLRMSNGETVVIRLADVDERQRSPKSLMPEGAVRDLSAQQAADLLAYLASLQAR